MPIWNLMTRTLVVVFWGFCFFGAMGGAVAVPHIASAVQTADGRAAVHSGVELERSRKWLDAIEHYEDSLKRWPESKELQYGLRRSKIHFGIERRYADDSFEEKLLRMSQRQALSLFEEVLRQIRLNYVDPISPTSFVAHGTESLYLALANDKFLRRNLPRAAPDRVRHVRKVLREEYWNKPVANGAQARETVSRACELADSLLGLPGGVVVMEYIFGGCNALDDYSNFLTSNRLNDLYGNIEGEFVGLGIEMKAEVGEGMRLVNVLPESPAAEGGLLPGDSIVGIDGIDCRDMTTDEAAKLLRGPPGTRVRLRIQGARNGSLRDDTFVRRAVHVKSIPIVQMLDREAGIAYIQMAGFQATSTTELDDALESLRRQGMQALIWDLRGNPGGLLTAAVKVLDRFIDDGVLVSTRGRTPEQTLSYSARRSGTWNVPLVVLVDGDSASASEIIAGAIRDHKRGSIVGRPTYGKWSVQSIFPVRDATGLRLTTAKFYSPDGHSLGEIGVKPDVLVEVPEKRTTYFRGPQGPNLDEDPDLQKGVEVLRSRVMTRR